MQIYKALQPIQALSFDLDDTLYHNGPVIEQAELAMQHRLLQLVPQFGRLSAAFWWQQRKMLAATDPDIRHDVSRWRLLALEHGLAELGLPSCEASEVAELAFDAFYQQRSRLEVPTRHLQLLAALGEKYPLVTITNGNANPWQLGLAPYFRHHYRAGPDGRMKPFADMFHKACAQLAIAPAQLLHIGDNGKADVMGALHAGCQAAWLQHPGSQCRLLPQIRISTLDQLELLL